MSAKPVSADTLNDGYTYIEADTAKREILFALCRRYKGIDPEIDRRIDANAALIAGNDLVMTIPAERAGVPRVPIYLEGEPGVGKTTLIEMAIREFCEIAGLNFVYEPSDGYQMQPNDFYYAKVNLSGKQNVSDFGGLPMRTALTTARANGGADRVLDEMVSRVKAVAAFADLKVAKPKEYELGGLRGIDLTVTGNGDTAAALADKVLRGLFEETKDAGIGVTALRDGAEPLDGRISYSVTRGSSGVRIHAYAPITKGDEHVAALLPNMRFALAKKARFALFNFDDVANANENVRNVLLEVAQSNRYSGVMDIGNGMITFTGNMGADDNTNTMSRQSDAEVTRIRKYRIVDTPQSWARRTLVKYNDCMGADCHFATFVERQGNVPGIFREPPGTARGKRGVPKTNSRALENAMSVVDAYFMMAHESKISPLVFRNEIVNGVSSSAGKRVADAYIGHVTAMVTEAIPLAQQCLRQGDLDLKKINKLAGNMNTTSERDFMFRFAAALADEGVLVIREALHGLREKHPRGIADPVTQDTVAVVVDRLCTGLAQLDPTMMNYSLSRVMSRLAHTSDFGSDSAPGLELNDGTSQAFSLGFAKSLGRKNWPDPAQAEVDFIRSVTGSYAAGTPATSKPR